MPVPVTLNGTVYQIPVQGDQRWAPPLTRYLIALASATLQPVGGTFTLTGDVNFGATYGLLSAYFSSRNTPATSGLIRLSKTDTIDWRNNAGSGNNVLSTDASDNLVWNGTIISSGFGLGLADGKIWIGSSGGLPVAQTLTGDVTVSDVGLTSIGALKIVNAQVSNSAAIAYSKLSLTGSIVNNDIYASAGITYSKLALSNSIVNGDIAAAAAIAYSKLATLTASKVLVSDGSGVVSASTITTTTLGYLDPTSSIQTQLNGKQATLTTGNLTDAGTDGITVTGGTGAVIGSGTSLSQHVADSTHNGYLSSTDWSTFNGKQNTLSAASASVSGYLTSTDWSTFNGKQNAFSGLTTDGVIYASSATAVASTAAGTTGQFLAANTGAAPTWGTPSGSGTVNSGTQYQLGYYATTTNAISGLTLITASRALVSDANGLPVAATTTATEIGYVNGVTSAIQTQLNAKQAALTAGQLPGTATNDSASAGNVGQYIVATQAAGNVGSSGTYGNITNIALTAGDWDVTGIFVLVVNGAVISGDWLVALSIYSGNTTTDHVLGDNNLESTVPITGQATASVTISAWRVSLTGNTTIYAKARTGFSGATPNVYARLSARRVR